MTNGLAWMVRSVRRSRRRVKLWDRRAGRKKCRWAIQPKHGRTARSQAVLASQLRECERARVDKSLSFRRRWKEQGFGSITKSRIEPEVQAC